MENGENKKNYKDDLLINSIASIFEEEAIPGELMRRINEELIKETDRTLNGFEKLVDDFGSQVIEFERYCSNAATEIISGPQRIFEEAFNFLRKRHRQVKTTSNKLKNIMDYAGKELEFVDEKTLMKAPDEYFETTVFALAKLAEMRDPETGFHLERTREYSMLISKQLQLDGVFVRTIYSVGPLHDVGKVGVRDDILLKPGRLSADEYEEIKKHTLMGAETIKSIISNAESENYKKMAEDIVLSHHEKFNGSGYPFGLKGEEIPLAARIFAIADAYDAIVSKRPYKEPLPHREAVERIIKDSGSHFDPEVVKAFIEVERDFLEVKEKYCER